MMRSESHLELIPLDGVRFFMCFYICVPPISQHDLLPIVALHNLQLVLYYLELVIDIHGFHGVRESWRLGPLEFSKLVSLLRPWCLLVLLHISQGLLHVDHALLHSLEHLSLHHQNMLQGWWGWWAGSVVVLSIIVLSVGVAAPCVGHLMDR
jgi:hypothetical protein